MSGQVPEPDDGSGRGRAFGVPGRLGWLARLRWLTTLEDAGDGGQAGHAGHAGDEKDESDAGKRAALSGRARAVGGAATARADSTFMPMIMT